MPMLVTRALRAASITVMKCWNATCFEAANYFKNPSSLRHIGKDIKRNE